MRYANGRMKLLVTGFGPFPGTPDNPSERLVRAIETDASTLPRQAITSCRILPTSWSSVAEMLPRLIRAEQPDLILHFGFAKGARGFRLEQVARNLASASKDVDGELPKRPSFAAGGLPFLHTDLPASRIALHLRARGIQSELSKNAGNYLCNNAFYISLSHTLTAPRAMSALFVHIPEEAYFARPEAPLHGARVIMRACVEAMRSNRAYAA